MSDDRKLESVRFAQESAKQIIALSTGIVTLVLGAVSVGAIVLKAAAFIFAVLILGALILSLFFGIFTLYALSGVLSDEKSWAKEDPLNTAHYRFFGRGQFVTFFIGAVLVATAALFWPQKDGPGQFKLSGTVHLRCHDANKALMCDLSE